MKLKVGRVLSRLGLGLGLFALGFAGLTWARQARHFSAPDLDIRASVDPAVVERGRYLVEGPAHCADCHGARPAAGLPPENTAPLSGGYEFKLPPGVFRVPNITSDAETGIGRYSDRDLARILRYGVRPDGTAVLPFMPFAELADDDLTAVISYLRATQPVHHEVPAHEVNLLGNVVRAWLLTPVGPKNAPEKHAPRGAVAENGRYLAHHVANCVSCHTRMDMRTGERVGPLFGGGGEHPALDGSKKTYLSPNLTPDPRWGWMEGWDESAFAARLRSGVGREGSPMPWRALKELSEEDARAIFLYLRSLPKAEGGPDPRERDPVQKLASGS
ncbi:MAG TPA: c-type cytochrome [Polyangiaceae bacterium]|nr:c-type cytochrome [Polyangiaceae bacterium]